MYQGHSVLRWLEVWWPTAPLFRAFSKATGWLGLGKEKTPNWSSWDVELGGGSGGVGTGAGSGNAENTPPPRPARTDPSQPGRNSTLEAAPNILLNLHHGSGTGDLVFAAISGIILQLGVVVFSGFVTYYGAIRPGVPAERTKWGYPLLAIGTALLAAGMIIASAIIEQSTTEAKWRVRAPKKDGDRDVQVLWLQKQHIVGDQSFDSFVLQAKEDCREVLTSRRSPALTESIEMDNASPVDSRRPGWTWVKASVLRIARTHTEALTLVGTVVGLAGFVLQFQGFRGVHWTCPLAQLAAIGVMTTLRAWVRRGLTVRPRADCVTSEHEMDWLADNMASRRTQFWPGGGGGSVPSLPVAARSDPEFRSKQNWSITFAYRGLLDQLPSEEDFRESDAKLGQRAVNIRRRLGALTKWIGPVTEPAAAAAAAIKKVMDTFVCKGDKFVWILDMPQRGSIYQIRIAINRDESPSSSGGGGWKDLSAEIEAVLSLWLFDIKNNSGEINDDEWRKGTAEAGIRTRSRYILGPNTNNCLKLDVAWWVSNEVSPEERRETYENDKFLENHEIVVGYRGVRTHEEGPCEHRPLLLFLSPLLANTMHEGELTVANSKHDSFLG